MFWRTLRVACICGVVAAVAAPACGGDASNPGNSSAGVGGSSGGSGGSAGNLAMAGGGGKPVVPTLTCGSKSCKGVLIPVQDFIIPPCCADAKTNQCGLDSSVLAAFGPTFAEACQPLAQPGSQDKQCPDSPKTPVMGSALTIAFPGCCRANNTCGFQLDSIGGIVPLGLGCVDSAPFLDGGAPLPCGDVGIGGAGGEAGASRGGAAGDSSTAGAAGESAGGVAGS